MELRFLGGAGTVTGSRYLVTHGGRRLLVDCGLFQGYKALRLRNWEAPPFDPAKLEGVVLTHAHLDHSGALPRLVKQGFRGPIHCTEATFELARILLRDSAYLQEEQAAHANRHGYSKHKPALPLYTGEDAEAALRLFDPMRFHERRTLAPGVDCEMVRAGHILGAASVALTVGNRRYVFSGDLGRPDDAVMRAPEPVREADVLVLESTYGGRLHQAADPSAAIAEVVNTTASRGGVVVVPAFAVGRVQALLLYLSRLRQAGTIPRSLPIYLDSPMGADVTRLYLANTASHRLSPQECEAMAHVAHIVQKPQESEELDRSPWPMVIIAGSGMAAGGRVLHHLKRFAPDARNSILFAGFQAPGTRGADLVRGVDAVKIHGEWVRVRARVHNIDSLSAHADEGQLVDWLRQLERPPARIFLTHGEAEATDALRKRIARELGWSCEIPEHLATIRFEGDPT